MNPKLIQKRSHAVAYNTKHERFLLVNNLVSLLNTDTNFKF